MTFGPRHLAGGVLAALALGALAYVSGVAPIAASTGHWGVTEWFLEYGMRRAVATHARGIRPPVDLADPDLVRLGAAHYETGCAWCHGSPGTSAPPVAAAMLPPPPDLSHAAEEWTDGQLFYIVRHGIRFAGMPAWPAEHRDDEVWTLVAFLRRLPGLDATAYDELAGVPEPAPPGVPQVVGEQCARCHGLDGLGEADVIPRLAGQKAAYLEASLAAYAAGTRPSGVMEPVAHPLTPTDRADLARYYAGLPAPARAASDPAAADRGERLAHGGPGVPACVHCHGPTVHPTRPLYPELAGQPEAYLVRQLELFASGHRGGTRWAPVMAKVARRGDGPHQHLRPEQMRDLAAWFAALPPDDPPGIGRR